VHAGIQQRDQGIERARSHTGIPARQHVRPERHRRAHGTSRERLADPGRMAAEQVQLQGAQGVVRDPHIGERSEAGVDAVDGFVALGLARDHSARRIDARPRGLGETDRTIVVRDCGDILQRQRLTIEEHHASPVYQLGSRWSRDFSRGRPDRASSCG
jgi:hypothetical protein